MYLKLFEALIKEYHAFIFLQPRKEYRKYNKPVGE